MLREEVAKTEGTAAETEIIGEAGLHPQAEVRGGDQDIVLTLPIAVVTPISGSETRAGTASHPSRVPGRTRSSGGLKKITKIEVLTSTARPITNFSSTQCITIIHTKLTEIHTLKCLKSIQKKSQF